MLNCRLWIGFIFLVWLVPNVAAQDLCATSASTKVACTVTNVYGVGGLTNGAALAPHNVQLGVFSNSFLTNLTALNSAIGTQLGQLPLVSPASGVAVTYDPALHVFVPAEYNFGPILSERVGTIGRHKLLFGFSYQWFDFATLDGLGLNNLPAVFTQQNNGGCSLSGTNTNACAYIRDVIVTRTNIDLRVGQYTAFASFGLTNRLDISVAVPVINVRMSVTSAATVKNNGSDNNFQFLGNTAGQGCAPNPCFNRTFYNANGATGIGDVTVRGKYSLWTGEHAGLAVGGDIRFPTGDSLNYLGAGAYGIKPFGAFSYSPFNRLSTHLNVGYEWNGSSFLAGDISPSQAGGTVAPTKSNLPGQFLYTAGAELGIIKRLSGAVDFLGHEYFNGPQVRASTFQELPACSVPPSSTAGNSACNSFVATGATDPNFQSVKDSYNTVDAAVGLRFRPIGKFLVTANVLIKLNDAGLRSQFVPLLGVTYSH